MSRSHVGAILACIYHMSANQPMRRLQRSAATPSPTRVTERSQTQLATPAVLLTRYIKTLSNLPPFSPRQERDLAREIAAHDAQLWRGVLEIPRAVSYLLPMPGFAQPPVQADLRELAAAYTNLRGAVESPETARLSARVRRADADKEALDAALRRLQRDVERPGLPTDTALRLPAALEQAQRTYQDFLTARNHFLRGNLRLVVSIARSFQPPGLSFLDSIQEGNVGLMKAVHRFDHQRGLRFSTYAHWWIKHCIRRAITNTGHPIRLPVHAAAARQRVEKAQSQLCQQLGRRPDNDEIAAHLQTSRKEVELALADPWRLALPFEEPLRSGRHSLAEILTNPDTPSIDELVDKIELRRHLEGLLRTLNPLEQDVLCRRYGLHGSSAETLDQVSRTHNLSRERVRQIQQSGMTKLRRLCKRRGLGV